MAAERSSALLEALRKQKLSKEEMLVRLDAIAAAECALPEKDRDTALISACMDLQWFLLRGEHYESRKEAAGEKLAHELEQHAQCAERERTGSSMRRRAVIVACCALLLLVLPFAGQTLLNRERIAGKTVREGEIYRLNGEAVDPQLIEKAIADMAGEDLMISTSDSDMIAKIPGVEEMQINYVPKGWKGSEYFYTYDKGIVVYREQFTFDGYIENVITYKCTLFPDAESVESQIQQNKNGLVYVIGNKTVYFSTNYEQKVATWNDGLKNCTIYGPVDQEEIEKMIESIGSEIE